MLQLVKFAKELLKASLMGIMHDYLRVGLYFKMIIISHRQQTQTIIPLLPPIITEILV